jgi:hypothetical protein
MHTSSFSPSVDFIANGGQTDPLDADARASLVRAIG